MNIELDLTKEIKEEIAELTREKALKVVKAYLESNDFSDNIKTCIAQDIENVIQCAMDDAYIDSGALSKSLTALITKQLK